MAGLTAGMKFAVLSAEPVEVRDPITNELLDVVDREKVRVEAHEVPKKVAICRTYRSYCSTAGRSWPQLLNDEQSYVKINDRVIRVAE